jgi:hypothetical protein
MTMAARRIDHFSRSEFRGALGKCVAEAGVGEFIAPRARE